MSRPEKWQDTFLPIAQKACELGATDLDLAEMLGVCVRTISYWRSSRPEFARVLTLGKEIADKRVVGSLYQRAMGYSHPDVDIRVVDGQIVQTELIKHYPPDTTAMIFWLKNRDPSNWRDKTDIEHSGSIAVLTDEQIDQKIRELGQQV